MLFLAIFIAEKLLERRDMSQKEVELLKSELALEKLARKEAEQIIENNPFGIVVTNSNQIVRTNKKIQELLGYNDIELSQKKVKDISLEEDFLNFKVLSKKMSCGVLDDYQVSKRYVRKNGSILWSKTKVKAIKDDDGNIKCQVAIIEDITLERERKLILDMINNLAKSILGKESIYEIAWEITKNIVEYLEADDCVIYIVNGNNLEQVAIYGSKDTGLKKIDSKVVMSINEGICGYVARNSIGEIVNDTSKDDRYIVDDEYRLSEICVPIINEGKVIGLIDSEHKEKNHFRKDQLATLQNIANIVSLQLHSAINIKQKNEAEQKNEALLKELEKSNDELNEYAHIVSHDLKSPLRSINALLEWIKMDNPDKFNGETLNNFNLIENTIVKMDQLISDILLYSSIGSTNATNKKVDLNFLIKELLKILYIPKEITIKIINKLPIVIGDPVKLQQLFQNLISNAVKFNDKENGLIEIDVIDKKTFYQFSVKDNGIGIEKKYHDKIFKIFNSINQNKESTGIGLSIVKKIVDIYDGEVWLESEYNFGTTFYFTFKKDL
jgi:PAS domain S-box-containing protein